MQLHVENIKTLKKEFERVNFDLHKCYWVLNSEFKQRIQPWYQFYDWMNMEEIIFF